MIMRQLTCKNLKHIECVWCLKYLLSSYMQGIAGVEG